MLGGADNHRAPPAALLPIAVVAVAVVVLALVVKGNQRGTIVVERIVFTATTGQNGRTLHAAPVLLQDVTETSADGALQRSLTSNAFSSAGFQSVSTGQAIELYDPRDNTIYVTTQRAQERAQGIGTDPATASHSGARVQRLSARYQLVPGRRSIFAQQLSTHQYRIAGRASIGGRPALRLTETRATAPQAPRNSGKYEIRATAYVSPGTYDPIEEVTGITLPGIRSTAVYRWTTYRVLPATAANQRLLSLTARHPQAQVVGGARAYMRASQDELGTTHVPRGVTIAGSSGRAHSAQ